MRVLPARRHRIAAAVTAATLALGGGTAAVIASTTTPPASGVSLASATVATPAAATTRPARVRRARALLRRADHATLEVKVQGQWVTFDLDRGKVATVSPTAITLQRPDGQSVTLQITGATHFNGVASEAAVRTGAAATVISDNGTARRIVQRAHPAAAATATGQTAA